HRSSNHAPLVLLGLDDSVVAHHSLAWLDITEHGGSDANGRPFADLHALHNGRVQANPSVIFDDRRTAHYGPGSDDDVLADLGVVADVHQVVDLGVGPNDRVREGAPVDGGVRPD